MRAQAHNVLARDARIAVVGLGAAGIATVLELRAAGFSDITVFEATPNAGGTWVYSANTKNAQSSMYKSLHCNIPKVSMCYVDRPFQEHARSFASHSDVAEYLQTIVADEGILPLVRFGSPVAKIAPTRPDDLFTGWAVQTFVAPRKDAGGEEIQEARINSSGASAVSLTSTHHSNEPHTPRMLSDVEIFDAVLVCNGHYTVPNSWVPDGADHFPGSISHSHTYRTPDKFRGKKVVVLGAGPSGTDIAIELKKNGADAYLSHRGGAGKGKYGGLVPQAAAVVGAKANGSLVLADGSEIEKVDELLLCTGYAYSFPFLSDDCGIEVSADRRTIRGMFAQCVNAQHPTMGIIGMPFKVIPFPLFQDQASLVASMLRGTVPFEVSKEVLQAMVDEEVAQRPANVPEKHFHSLDDAQWAYREMLVRWSGRSLPEGSIIEMYQDSRDARSKLPLEYRKREYKKFGPDCGDWAVTFRGVDVTGDMDPKFKPRAGSPNRISGVMER